MERDSIPPQVGMLFPMPRTEPQTFWMANTPHALDIFFVGEDSTVLNVAKYTVPYSTQGVSSVGPARYRHRAGRPDRVVAHGDRDARLRRRPARAPRPGARHGCGPPLRRGAGAP
jgi:hypothetical protein